MMRSASGEPCTVPSCTGSFFLPRACRRHPHCVDAWYRGGGEREREGEREGGGEGRKGGREGGREGGRKGTCMRKGEGEDGGREGGRDRE